MKKTATRLLYVFSFSLLFTALYLNFFQREKSDFSFFKPEKKTTVSATPVTETSAVAQPENNTALK